MPKCCVIGCASKYSSKQIGISFHRLPRKEAEKQKWLESIGSENIDLGGKQPFVCSLHFEESCINRTLDVVRLHDNAVPTLFLTSAKMKGRAALTTANNNLEENSQQDVTAPTSVLVEHQQPQTFVQSDYRDSLPGTSAMEDVTAPTLVLVEQQPQTFVQSDYRDSLPGTSAMEIGDPISSTSNQAISGGLNQSIQMQKIADKFSKLKKKYDLQQKKMKKLNEKCRRQSKKIADFSAIINELKNKKFIDGEASIMLQDCSGPKDFLMRQVAKSKGLSLSKQYSEEIRKFALTLNFLSPAAYNFVRKTYNSCLPHKRTLSKWYQKIDAEPGFTKEAFEALKLKVKLSDRPVLCSLILDEMSIRKSLNWDLKKKRYFGRVDLGIDIDSDNLEEANQCLVILLVAINDSWKLPIGYFFVTSLTGETKSNLVRTAIELTEETGSIIVALTCDGPAANFSMLENLGCKNISQNPETVKFMHSNSVVNVFIDPCHSLKLMRNAFGELGILRDIQNRKINFKHVSDLHKLQDEEGLHLATKLTKSHINFDKQKMKVRLATQLLSNSVADALYFCEEILKIPNFQDCSGTTNFVRTLNYIFDVLNSRSMRPPGLKKALNPGNIYLITEFILSAIDYISTLRLETGELLIKSRRKTGAIGLIICMKSALELYKRLVEEKKWLIYLPLYKISQDHLELFFSSIRARGGFNNNPNALQFRAAYKRLLIRTELRDHGMGNCIPLEQINILTCSSADNPIQNINDLTEQGAYADIPEDDSELYHRYLMHINNLPLNEYSESVVEYIGGFIARKLSRSLKCDRCIILLTNLNKTNKINLITVKSRGGLIYPSKDVLDILKKTEQLLKPELRKSIRAEKYYLYIYKFVLDFFETKDIFVSDAEHDAVHKLLLIKSVIELYVDIRFKYYGKKITEKVTLRNYLNKAILFRNE